MQLEVAGTWLAKPRIAVAIRALDGSPTAEAVLQRVASHRTLVSYERQPSTLKQFERRKASGLIASR